MFIKYTIFNYMNLIKKKFQLKTENPWCYVKIISQFQLQFFNIS